MAVLRNIARVRTATVGAGAVTLGAAVPGYKTFVQAGCVHGEVLTYGIHDFDALGNLIASEVGRGTYNAVFGTLARTTVLASTNADAALNLSGNAHVFITAIAEDFDHTSGSILNVGVNTHTQIDLHLSSVANPHATTASQVGAPALVNPSVVGNFVSFLNATGAQQDSGYSAGNFEPADATIVKTGNPNWIDLTDGGTTALHSHALDHPAVTLDANADTVLSLLGQALGLDTQTANRVFAGPTTGAATVPTFRALVAADIPSITVVDTRANIVASTPTSGKIAFATDIKRFYVANGTNWFQIVPNGAVADTNVSMGAYADPALTGYGDNYITDKQLSNVLIGGNVRTENGGLRVDVSDDPDNIEVYLRGAWYTIIYDLTIANLDFRHTPLSQQIYVWRGDSVALGLNGRPIIQEYQSSMGAYPPARILNGGTF